jgi:hypothetical protein
MEGLTTHWYVRVKFKHKPGWDYGLCKTDPPFLSKQAAEEHVEGLFGVEKWEVKEFQFTAKQAQTMERVRQIVAHWEAVYRGAPEKIQ